MDFSSLDYDVLQDYEGDAPESEEKPVGKTRAGMSVKTKFVMTDKIVFKMHYFTKMSLSDLFGQMNDMRDESNTKRLIIKAVKQLLLEEGLYELKFINRMPLSKITEYGTEFGVGRKRGLVRRGMSIKCLLYGGGTERDCGTATDL